MSTEQERRSRAAHDAAAWLLRLDSDSMSTGERAEFVDWLRESPLHVAEMLRLASLHRSLGRFSRWDEVASELVTGGTDGGKIVPLTYDTPTTPRPKFPRLKWIAFAAAAASIAIVSVLALLDTQGSIATQLGEKRAITLADGSEVTLAPNTRVRVRLDKERRVV